MAKKISVNKLAKKNKNTDAVKFVTNTVIDKIQQSVRYNVIYDYKSSYCTGNCDDYCRCTSIISSKINEVNVNAILSDVIDSKWEDVTKYCIDRILRYMLSEVNNYELIISRGYYGEECLGVKFIESSLDLINDKLKKFEDCKSDFEKIEFVLINEYGYLLETIANCGYSNVYIKTIQTSEIVKNENHYAKLQKSVIDSYDNYDLPRCICIKDSVDSKYRLIDGYHRYHSAINQKLKEITILELSY